jgi:hypothetical protein
METIKREDVISVATALKMTVSEEQIEEVITIYPTEADLDPTATWDLIIENILYSIVG